MTDNKKLIKAILRITALACVAVILGFNIYLWNAQSLTGNVLPMPFGVGMAVVLSGSMEPELSVDDVIIVQAQESYAVGDVVVYQNGGALVVHRIIKLDGETVTTKGDANNTEDSEMNISQVKGKVIGHIGGAGALVRFMKSPVVSVSMLGLSIFLMERSYRKEKEKGDDELDAIKEEIRRLKAEQSQ